MTKETYSSHNELSFSFDFIKTKEYSPTTDSIHASGNLVYISSLHWNGLKGYNEKVSLTEDIFFFIKWGMPWTSTGKHEDGRLPLKMKLWTVMSP